MSSNNGAIATAPANGATIVPLPPATSNQQPATSHARGPVMLSARNLGKRYDIARASASGPKATTMGEALLAGLRQPLQAAKAAKTESFWAVKGVHFDICEGDVVGVVGRNGAGKSTLLKLLSRITEPTEGEIDLYGRVGSLLEVGTGFHPELTGRENVYLNGSILGMTRREIEKQFDAIVEFAEVEKFLETPVKRYSSGMYVRLAFAVAAHLNPEILIVDEVLAVGDAAFQKKCLDKMQDVARGGRTVLFVSHNVAAVRALCNRAIFLQKGQLVMDEGTEAVVARYVRDGSETSAAVVSWREPDAACSEMRFVSARILDDHGAESPIVSCSEPWAVEIEYEVREALPALRIVLYLVTMEGAPLACCYAPHWSREPSSPGRYVVRCRFPAYLLNEGRFQVRLEADIPEDRLLIQTNADLGVTMEDVDGHGERAEKLPGLLRPRFTWESVVATAESGKL